MLIELPWINTAELHAHAKGHWRAKSEATKRARRSAKLIAQDGLNRKQLVAFTGKAKITYRFFVPDKRQRDEANMIQSCKPYIDGLVDAGLIAGDDWKKLNIAGVSVEVDQVNPRVELEFE
jgi:hypothetical protein